MSKTIIPQGYHSVLSLYETQKAIGLIHHVFEEKLGDALNLRRVSAPLFVEPHSGLNDDLSGVERPVRFDVKETGTDAVVVHSLAKWKRMALHRYGFSTGEGIYTDMNAIRRDEELDNLHSIYVDQWDWEKVITKEDRNFEYLRRTVDAIVGAIYETQIYLTSQFPSLPAVITPQVKYITSQELEDMYPDKTPKERENLITKQYRTVFLSQIGKKLRSGERHDGRAPDYDDWDLNGDILFYCDTLDCAFEVSSMGIRVSPQSLDRQLTEAGADDRRALPFHKMLLDGKLPYTVGGGIGQSRLSMLLLSKAHIGEVQSSVWDEDTHAACSRAGIILL